MGDPARIAGVPFLAAGRILTTMARPYRVVADNDTVIVAVSAPRIRRWPRWIIDEDRYVPEPAGRRWRRHCAFFFPGKLYDITLFFETSGEVPWFYDPLFKGEGMTPGWRERRKAAGT